MSDLNREIGARIRGVRDVSELSPESFAASIHIAPALLAQYEKGEVDIPVSVLHDISAAFDISMTELLTGEPAKLSIYSVVRAGKGVGIERREAYDYKSLAYNFAGRKIDPFLITVEPKPEGGPIHMTAHEGHEFHYCLEGKVKTVINKHEIVLEPGDSIYFDSTYPHGLLALDGKPARLLVVITGKD